MLTPVKSNTLYRKDWQLLFYCILQDTKGQSNRIVTLQHSNNSKLVCLCWVKLLGSKIIVVLEYRQNVKEFVNRFAVFAVILFVSRYFLCGWQVFQINPWSSYESMILLIGKWQISLLISKIQIVLNLYLACWKGEVGVQVEKEELSYCSGECIT